MRQAFIWIFGPAHLVVAGLPDRYISVCCGLSTENLNYLRGIDQSAHYGVGFEAWTYPWIAPLFWIYQSTDSSDNTLDWQVYGAGYVAAVAYHTQLSGRVNLWKGF